MLIDLRGEEKGRNIDAREKHELLYFAVYNVFPCFWPTLLGEKSFVLFFQLSFLFIYLYLDTCFLVF